MKSALNNISIIVIVLFFLSFITYKVYWVKESSRVRFSKQRIFYPSLDIEKYYTLNFTPTKISEINDSILLLENQQMKEVGFFNKKNGKPEMLLNKNKDSIKLYKFISQVELRDDRVYVTDSKTNHITTYNINSKEITVDSIRFNFSRVVNVMGDSIFLFQRSFMKAGISRIDFSLVNIKTGKIIRENLFNNIFSMKENSDMIYDGFFSRIDSVYYYTCYQENQFFAFNEKMDLLYKSKMIYNTPSPVIKNSGRIKYIESSYIGVINVTSNKDSILILSNIGDKSCKGQRVVDVYYGPSGEYAHSITVPNNGNKQIPSEVYKGKKGFYFVYSDGFGYCSY